MQPAKVTVDNLIIFTLVAYSDVCVCAIRLIGHAPIVEMTKWYTQHYRQDQQMKAKLCSTCVPNAGIISLPWCCSVNNKLVSRPQSFPQSIRKSSLLVAVADLPCSLRSGQCNE